MICLKLVKGGELAEGVRTEMQLSATTPRFVVGRDPSAHWLIPDRTLAISARHCEMVAAHGGMVLRDLSTNGTFVNGSPARLAGEHALQDGDRIELGPYTILVQSGLPRPAAVPAKPAVAPAPPPARSPSVEATTPLRGGDPAAMLGSAAGASPRAGLTEILRAAAPVVDESLEVTKIRMAPKPAAKADRPAGATPMPTVAVPAQVQAAVAPLPSPPLAATSSAAPPAAAGAAPAAAAAGAPTASAQASPNAAAQAELSNLASGLGLPADALAGHSPAQAAAQVAALARAGVVALRALLEQQALARRQIGSRAPALGAVRELNTLRLAPTPEAALLALLAPGSDAAATLQRATDELAAHQARLLAAFRGAATRLGEEIAPNALQAALGAAAPAASQQAQPAEQAQQAQQAQLWALYTQIWQSLGLAPGQPWAQGFQEAALMHLAAVYDETSKT